ncbi:MAG: family containing protein [Planctomycetaceae bacterium]|nr:family containing protein [Planctomycetaceae bacterium]
MRRLSLGVCLGVAAVLAVSSFMRPTVVQGEGEKAASTRVFEMRTYIAPPGKLAALHARFRDHTLKLFEKHGMKNVVYLSPTDPKKGVDNRLVYIISHDSKAASEKSWAAFKADPEWQAAYKASEKDGKLVEKVEVEFFTATDYSPIK